MLLPPQSSATALTDESAPPAPTQDYAQAAELKARSDGVRTKLEEARRAAEAAKEAAAAEAAAEAAAAKEAAEAAAAAEAAVAAGSTLSDEQLGEMEAELAALGDMMASAAAAQVCTLKPS